MSRRRRIKDKSGNEKGRIIPRWRDSKSKVETEESESCPDGGEEVKNGNGRIRIVPRWRVRSEKWKRKKRIIQARGESSQK
ncbi:hypothetical protein [Ferdinandcohnia sp. Marseille-Q9671]